MSGSVYFPLTEPNTWAVVASMPVFPMVMHEGRKPRLSNMLRMFSFQSLGCFSNGCRHVDHQVMSSKCGIAMGSVALFSAHVPNSTISRLIPKEIVSGIGLGLIMLHSYRLVAHKTYDPAAIGED